MRNLFENGRDWVELALLVSLYCLFHFLLLSIPPQPETYSSAIPLIRAALTPAPLFIGILGICGLAFPSKFRSTWLNLKSGTQLKYYSLACMAPLLIRAIASPPNFNFGNTFLAEKFMVATTFLGSYFTPRFIPFFLYSFLVIQGSGYWPLENIHLWTDSLAPVSTMLFLCLFTAAPKDTFKLESLVLVSAICLTSFYFIPGMGKLMAGWAGLNSLSAAESFTSLLGYNRCAKFLLNLISFKPTLGQQAEYGLQVMVLLVEIGALSVGMISFRLFPILAMVLIPLHLGAWAFNGFFFWPYILSAAAINFLYLRNSSLMKNCRLRAFALVVAAPLWSPAKRLTWFDTPVGYTYSVHWESPRSDLSAPIDTVAFGAYAPLLYLNELSFLNRDKILPLDQNITGDPIWARALGKIESPEQLQAEIRVNGRIEFDPIREEKFSDLLKNFGRHFAARDLPDRWLYRVGPMSCPCFANPVPKLEMDTDTLVVVRHMFFKHLGKLEETEKLVVLRTKFR